MAPASMAGSTSLSVSKVVSTSTRDGGGGRRAARGSPPPRPSPASAGPSARRRARSAAAGPRLRAVARPRPRPRSPARRRTRRAARPGRPDGRRRSAAGSSRCSAGLSPPGIRLGTLAADGGALARVRSRSRGCPPTAAAAAASRSARSRCRRCRRVAAGSKPRRRRARRAPPRRPCRTGSARPGWRRRACPTLASASCATRNSATSRPGGSTTGSPVVSTRRGDAAGRGPLRPARRSPRAAAPPPAARARSAWTDRRASVRLSRASRGPRRRAAALAGSPSGVGGLELGDDPGEALREGVVDLAGHPLPLVEHPGLAGLGEQLGVQARRSPPASRGSRAFATASSLDHPAARHAESDMPYQVNRPSDRHVDQHEHAVADHRAGGELGEPPAHVGVGHDRRGDEQPEAAPAPRQVPDAAEYAAKARNPKNGLRPDQRRDERQQPGQ